MNESSAPWRALEEPVAADGAVSPGHVAPTGRDPRSWVLIALAAAAIVAGGAIWIVLTGSHGSIVVEGGGPAPGRSQAAAVAGAVGPDPAASPAGKLLVVDVQGAVVRPGIVRIPGGSRVGDAIAAAGGYGPRVAADRLGRTLNLAALVKDGDQISVPSRDDPAGGAGTGGATTGGGGGGGTGGGGSAGTGAPSGPIDLNRATATELDALPGIGPVSAAKIVAARAEQAFTAVDDLKTRKIVGAATFEKIKNLVVVR